MAPASASFDAGQPLDLEASLLGGQAHRWKRATSGEGGGDWYSGVLRGNLMLIRQHGRTVEFHGAQADQEELAALIGSHLRLEDDLKVICAEIASDPNVAAQVARYPGLRVLRQEPWECLVAYICSANSNIETIHLNMERLSNEFGEPLTLPHPDPRPGDDPVIRRNTFPQSRGSRRGGRDGVAPVEAGIPRPLRPPGRHRRGRKTLGPRPLGSRPLP